MGIPRTKLGDVALRGMVWALAAASLAPLVGAASATGHREATTIVAVDGNTWFVDNTAAPGGDGSVYRPFGSLKAAERAAGPNDGIFVNVGDGTDHGMKEGIILKPGQKLVGGREFTLTPTGVAVASGGSPLITLSRDISAPGGENTAAAGGVINLADDVTVMSLAAYGTAIPAVGTSPLAHVSNVTLQGVSASAQRSPAVELNGVDGTFDFGNLESIESTSDGAVFNQVSGTVQVKGTTKITKPARNGASITDNSADITFQAPFEVIDFGGNGLAAFGNSGDMFWEDIVKLYTIEVSGAGINAADNTGAMSFESQLDVATNNAPGVDVADTDMAFKGGANIETGGAAAPLRGSGDGQLTVTGGDVFLNGENLESAISADFGTSTLENSFEMVDAGIWRYSFTPLLVDALQAVPSPPSLIQSILYAQSDATGDRTFLRQIQVNLDSGTGTPALGVAGDPPLVPDSGQALVGDSGDVTSIFYRYSDNSNIDRPDVYDSRNGALLNNTLSLDETIVARTNNPGRIDTGEPTQIAGTPSNPSPNFTIFRAGPGLSGEMQNQPIDRSLIGARLGAPVSATGGIVDPGFSAGTGLSGPSGLPEAANILLSNPVANPRVLNPVPDARNPAVQLMIVVEFLLALQGRDQLPPPPPEPPSMWSAFRRVLTFNGLDMRPARPNSVWGTAPTLRSRVIRVARPASRAPTSTAQSSPVQMFLTNVGNSTGEAFTAHFLNNGDEPIDFDVKGMVVEPLKEEAQRLVQEQLARALPQNPVTANLNAYCLEFLRAPPSAGEMFQVAPKVLQDQFAPVRDILSAAQQLNDLGLLPADSDPMSYFHAMNQWSIWSDQEDFDEPEFTDAFVANTRKQVEDSGAEWTDQFDQVLRGAAPARWANISRILQTAALNQQ